jgi:conjugative transfer region protein TrbK
MNPASITPVAAIVLLAGTMLACAIELGRLGGTSEPSVVPTSDTNEPFARELARCKALGSDAVNDAACRAAWKESRERFLKGAKPDQRRAIDPFRSTTDGAAPNTRQKLFLDRAPSTPPSGGAARPSTDREGR